MNMLTSKVISLLTFILCCGGQDLAKLTCSTDRSEVDIGPVDANVILGALFDIRGKGTGGFGCGLPVPEMMQVFEAARFTIDWINNNANNYNLPGVKMGSRGYDTCFSVGQALRGFQKIYPQSTSRDIFCNPQTSVTPGVVGPMSSGPTLAVAKLAARLSVSVVSPMASAPALSDKGKYPTFLRTVPSTAVHAQAVTDLLSRLGWENVVVVYVDTPYAVNLYQEVLARASTRGLCVSQGVMVQEAADDAVYRDNLRSFGLSSFTPVVFLGPNANARVMLQAAEQVPTAGNIQWVFSDLDPTQDISSLRYARGALTVLSASTLVDSFRDYFTSLEANVNTGNAGNPWFEEWFETNYGCSLSSRVNNPCPTRSKQDFVSSFVQSPYVVPTMKAIFAYAETVRSVCAGSGGGVCNPLRSISASEFNTRLRNINYQFPSTFGITELRNQQIRFDVNGDPVLSEYTVYNFNNRANNGYRFEELGSYTSNILTLSRLPVLYDSTKTNIINNPTANCSSVGCDNCLLPQRQVTFRYTPGNLVIASLVNGHLAAPAPFTCGSGSEVGLASLVAAEWAVGTYKTLHPGKLQGVSLGSLVADVCPDSYVADGFLTDLLSGNNRLTDAQGSVITAGNIQAFVDFTNEAQASSIGPVLTSYKIPEVQTGVSTSPDMQGFLSKALPDTDVYFAAIASLLQRLEWKYVQVASHMTGKYREQTEQFRQVAASRGVCITSVEDLSQGSNVVLQRLKVNTASVVVVIGSVGELRGLVEARRMDASSGPLFISGVEDFTRDPDLVTSVDEGLIVLEPALGPSGNFSSWLGSRSDGDIMGNVWLRELYELTNNCYLDTTTQGRYPRACGPTDSFNVYQGKARYVIESVFTVAEKLDELLSEVCRPGYNGVCSDFQSSTDISHRLATKLYNTGRQATGFEVQAGKGVTDYILSYRTQGNYATLGVFDTSSQRLLSENFSPLGNYTARADSCSGGCAQCQYLYTAQGGYFVPGDVIIAGTFSVSSSGPAHLQPYICGGPRTMNGPQYATAMMYAIDQVNSGAAPVGVRGLTVGGLSLDHCSNVGRAALQVADIYSGHVSDPLLGQADILAWLTDTTSSTMEAATILDPLEVAMVSPSATSASLMDLSTFRRTVQGDATVATVLVKLAKVLGKPYIQVVYSSGSAGEGGLATLSAVAEQEGICITSQVLMDSSSPAPQVIQTLLGSSTSVVVLWTSSSDTEALMVAATQSATARNTLLFLMPEPYTMIVETLGRQMTHPVLSVQLQTSKLDGYYGYLDALPTDNPIFARYYMSLKECNLPGYSIYSQPCAVNLATVTNDQNFEKNNFVESTIHAVYASVEALHLTLQEFCGLDYTQPCAAFNKAQDRRQRYNANLNTVSFNGESGTFRFLNREGNTHFDVLQNNAKIGSYAGVTLDVNATTLSLYPNVLSECLSPCLGCIARGLNFSYTPGDIYLAGMFDVHQKSQNPFTCGKVKTLHGFLLLEAFHYAINQVNEKKGAFANILKGTNLGGIGLDGCSSTVRSGYIVSNIHNSLFRLSRDGDYISPSSIDAYIGAYDSGASNYLARILTDLEIPQISYASSSSLLSDTRVFPHFYRTVPTDLDLIKAMLTFLDAQDIRYVQILYLSDDDGQSIRASFESLAADYRVCVAQAVNYTDVSVPSREASNRVVSDLIKKPAANTVVSFLDTDFVNSVLKAVARSERANGKLRFFGSDAWADNQEAIEGVEEDVAVGSLTIKLDSDDVESFDSYLASRTLANSDENPWFAEYYEEINQCYLAETDTKGYARKCSSNVQTIIDSQGYQQDPGVVYVMNAVYAAAYGLHATLKDYCGSDYTAVCQAYRNNVQRRQDLTTLLGNVDFVDPVGNAFMFRERAGVSNYRFNTIVKGIFGGANYNQIGNYNASSSAVSVSGTFTDEWNSGCEREDACAECPAIRDAGVRYVLMNSATNLPANAKTVVAFLNIHHQGVDPYRCGSLDMQGFHQMLALQWTVNNLISNKATGTNTNGEYPRGLRFLIVDTCSNALRVDQDLFGLMQGQGICNTLFESNGAIINLGTLGSVITAGDRNTMAAGRLLEMPGVTYVSPTATSPSLDGNTNLVRSVLPVSGRMLGLVNLLSALGWSYVDVVYEASLDGLEPWERFTYYANTRRVCQGSAGSVNADSSMADLQAVLSQLNSNRGSKAVVLIGGERFIRRVLQAAIDLNVARDYVWLVASEWEFTARDILDMLPGDYNMRLISVKNVQSSLANFNNYVSSLSYNPNLPARNNGQIPRGWWEEWYQMTFGCTLTSALTPLNLGKPECTSTERVRPQDVQQDPSVINTVAAAYSVVDGLRRVLDAEGSNVNLNNVTTREAIRSSILSTRWPFSGAGPSEDIDLSYNSMRWWDQGMEVWWWNLTQGQAGTPVKVWSGVVAAPTEADIYTLQSSLPFVSQCGEASGACGCTFDAYSPVAQRLEEPVTRVRNFLLYDMDGMQRYDWPVWAMVVSVLSGLGIVVTVILFLILLFAYPNRGGTTILGYMAIIGILGIYAINFAFFVPSSEAVCGARRFLMGVVYMITMAPLLIKAMDNWRFGHVEYAEERYSGISSACVLLTSAVGLVLMQCIVPIMWLVLVHPTASDLGLPGASHDTWWCDPVDDYDLGLVLSHTFVVFVILITAIFSSLAYDSDRNNYESRWILFSCIVTAGCMLVWMIVTTNAMPSARDPTVAIANFVNATLLLMILPLRKTVLLCEALREREKEKDIMAVVGDASLTPGGYEGYNNGYDNRTFELNDYDNDYVEG